MRRLLGLTVLALVLAGCPSKQSPAPGARSTPPGSFPSIPAPSPSPLTRPTIGPADVAYPESVRFVDERHGFGLSWLCNGDLTTAPRQLCTVVLLATSDGGGTWSARGRALLFDYHARDQYDSFHTSLAFSDLSYGWIYGSVMLGTIDGGLSWSPEALPTPVGKIVVRQGIAWALAGGCREGDCRPSVDVKVASRRTWSHVPTAPALRQDDRVFPLSSQSALLVAGGSCCAGTGTSAAVTFDRGRTWRPFHGPCLGLFAALDPSRLWAVCGEEPTTGDQATTIYRSTDGGKTWKLEADSPYPFEHRPTVGNVPTTGFIGNLVVTPNGVLYLTREKFGVVARSTDGGREWTTLPLTDDGGGGFDVQFVDDLHGWAFSSQNLYRTTDGGRRWTLVASRP
jgi:photosystem II stability/assembly factor-like uncharacterized protein